MQISTSPENSSELFDGNYVPEKKETLKSSLEKIPEILEIYRQLKPVTLSSYDPIGNRIQLWSTQKHGLFGVVINGRGELKIIPSHNIINPLAPKEDRDTLLKRLASFQLKFWSLVFDPSKCQITIWPCMVAAGGKNGDLGKVNDYHAAFYKKSSLQAAVREKNGEVVKFKSCGTPFNHIAKVDEHKEGLNKHISKLEQKLIDKNLSAKDRTDFQKELAQSKNLLKHVERYGYKYNVYQQGRKHLVHHEKKVGNVWNKHSELHKAPPKGDGNLPPKGFKGTPPPPTPGRGQLNETLQKTGLVKSYNSCHPDNPAPKGSGSGEIGGVGCSIELIEGLFDSPESLFETEHSFFIPEFEGGQIPFSSEEMCQIVHELAVGIYVHNTVPFFSLHFNQDANLYPVIHPAYENTLVGQVFGMLDYFMKGYLNGGIFKESFLQQWHKNPINNKVTQALLQELINFKSYSETYLQGSDRNYLSVRELIKKVEMNALEKANQALEDIVGKAVDKDYIPEDPIFKDYTRFTNSFRIIAKQRGIHKSDRMFMIDSDFDVEYTVDPDPQYKKALEEYYKLHGSYPKAYTYLLDSYELMKRQIHDHMVKMPFCKKYFAMLGVINFFSYYFRTLQKHNKMPILPDVELKPARCPSLFPPLPLLNFRKEELKANIYDVVTIFVRNHRPFLEKLLGNQFEQKEVAIAKDEIVNLFWAEMYYHASDPMKRHLHQNKDAFRHLAQSLADQLDLLKIFKEHFDKLEKEHSQIAKSKIIQVFLDNAHTIFENKLEPTHSLHLDLFVLPSEQTAEELEFGKKVVGGCGMDIAPCKLQLSPSAHKVLDNYWKIIQETPIGELTPIVGVDPGLPKGAIFTLPFIDIPIGFADNSAEMEVILTASSDLDPKTVAPMYRLIHFMTQGLKVEFKQHLKQESMAMRDTLGRTLLHHSALIEDSFFTQELLKLGFSPADKDGKDYLPIHYAAMAGHQDQLQILSGKNKSTIIARSNQGATPLIVAIQHSQIKAVEFLLSIGAEGNESLKDGYTALHCAVHHENEQVLRLLLESSKNALNTINTQTNEGITPLMIACQSSSFSNAAYLISKGANAKTTAKNGKTALEISVKKNHLKLCKLLAPLSILNPTIIEEGIKKSSLEINQLLSQMQGYLTYVNPLNETPLLIAIRYANIPVAMFILGFINDPNYLNVKNRLDESAVDLAIKGKFYPLVEALLQKGGQIQSFELMMQLLQFGYHGQNASINERLNGVWSANQLEELTTASAKAGNHAGISKLLVPKKANLSKVNGENGWKIDHYLAKSDGIFLFRKRLQETQDFLQPLHLEGGKTLPYIAGENGSWRVLAFLLDKMKSTNTSTKNHYRKRDLFYSLLKRGELEGIRLFVDKMGNPQLVNLPVDNIGTLPVHLAAQFCSFDGVEFLYKCGANFNVQDDQGQYPLNHAIRRQNKDLIRFFMDPKHSNPITAECLYVAASYPNDEIFTLLCSSGADLNECANPQKNTALMLAIKRRDKKTCLKLIQNGASVSHQNHEGWTPFLLASAEGELEVMDLILMRNPQAMDDKVKGDTALHIACQRGNEHCVQFLIEKGIPQVANSTGTLPHAFAKDNSVKAILKFQPAFQIHQQCLVQLHEAIENQNLSAILNSLSHWPLNSYFTINIKGVSIRGTLLHIALTVCKNFNAFDKLIKTILTQHLLDWNLRDSEGNSYAHLMIKGELDPTEYKHLDLEVYNHNNETPLHLASIEEESYCLAKMIKKLGKSKLNPTDRYGRTPLLHAIGAKKMKNACLLAKSGADLEHQDFQGITPLIQACALGNYPLIRKLVHLGADVNRKGGIQNITPLFVSLYSKHEDIPLFLLFHGAQLNSINIEGDLIGHLAAAKGKIYILRFLGEQGHSLSSLNQKGLQPIHHAALAGKIRSLEFLTDQGISIESPVVETSKASKAENMIVDATPLLLASREGTIEAVKWLIDHGANPQIQNSEGLNILNNALRNSSTNSQEIINLFKDYVLSHDLKQILPAMIVAIAKDYVDPLKLLYSMGVPILTKIEHGMTGLHYACQYGSSNVTEFLLSNGADTKSLSDSGEFPIELAASNNSPNQFNIMLMNSVFPLDYQNAKGDTLMHITARAGNLAHMMLLMDLGADFECQNSQGQTPLHIAAEKGIKDMVTLLMLSGADANLKTFFNSLKPEDVSNQEIRDLILKLKHLISKSPKGSTPLHYAVKVAHLISVKLTSRHFDSNEKNELGQTPLHEAVLSGSIEIARLLLDQGANPKEKDNFGKSPQDLAVIASPGMKQFFQALT